MKDKHIVQKARPLLSLNKSTLSLYEFKILDTYLSRINSHKPDERTVTFSKGEFEELFDYADMKMPELTEHLHNLQTLMVDVANKDNKYDNIVLFARATADKDRYGMWEVSLTCTPEAMKYFFNVENLGYLRYKLRNILKLDSRYSYLLFLYLIDNRFRKQWEIELDDLKVVLNCQDVSSYTSFKNFRRVVFDKCIHEIEEKTDIKMEYSVIKRGRFVQKIHFQISTWGDLAEITAKERLEQAEQNQITAKDDVSVMCELDKSIDRENMQIIYDLIIQLGVEKGTYGTGRIDYFKFILNRVAVAEKNEHIRNRAAYIKRMLLNEIKQKNTKDETDSEFNVEKYKKLVNNI